ncbi:MAG: HAD family hydrolase [Clostridium sp.]|nr:HAD family hydrolase [Clostridium sp.]
MIKLIVSDVDGTLVEDGSPALNPELFEVILKLREKGLQVVIASGRPWASVQNTFEPVKEKIFYVSNNGAYVGCYGRCLYAYSIGGPLVKRLVEKVRLYPDLEIVYAGVNGDYVETKSEELCRWLVDSYKFNLTRVEDLLAVDEPCVKISIYKPSGIEAATRDIYNEFKDELKIACAGDMWMDCMAEGVNKGRAVKTIQESLGISPKETMAFGDQLNDIEMLDRAYYSFAVANARDEVRKAARFQADSNVNDGVLKILKQLL